jgi:aspartate/tyrosine/aromatic aminotransferase
MPRAAPLAARLPEMLIAASARRTSASTASAWAWAHRGMFSLVGATPGEVTTLRDTHGVYLVGDGRMNVAGLTAETIPKVARALAEVLARADAPA